MLILIEKDSATRIPKECNPEQAEAFTNDFVVYVVNEDGSNTEFREWKNLHAEIDATIVDEGLEIVGAINLSFQPESPLAKFGFQSFNVTPLDGKEVK